MVDKKTKRKTLKKLASLSGYSYIDVEHEMVGLTLLVAKLTNSKTVSAKQLSHYKVFRDNDIQDLLSYLKGNF